MGKGEKIFIFLMLCFFIFNCSQGEKSELLVREDIKTSTISTIKTGNTYYFSGITARNPETNEYPDGMAAQTKAVMNKFKTALEELDMDWNNVVKANVYITDIKEKPAMNEVYFTYFEGFKRPCRVCVEAGLAGNAVVEIAMIAVKTAKQ